MDNRAKAVEALLRDFPLGDIPDELYGVYDDFFSSRSDTNGSDSEDEIESGEDDLDIGLDILPTESPGPTPRPTPEIDVPVINIADLPIYSANGDETGEDLAEITVVTVETFPARPTTPIQNANIGEPLNGFIEDDPRAVINEEDAVGDILEVNEEIRMQPGPDDDIDAYWQLENTAVENFLRDGCGCKKHNKGNCSQLFTLDELLTLRRESTALDEYEGHWNKLDLVILAQFRALSRCCSETVSSKKSTQKERTRSRMNYMLKGFSICEHTFMFANRIKIKRLRRLANVYKNSGLSVNFHGNTGRSPKTTTSFEVSDKVLKFLTNYAEQNAIFLPGRVATQFNSSIKLLPSSETKASVYLIYKDACEVDATPPVSLWLFRSLWRDCCSDIVVQRPMSDLCNTCQKNYTSISKLSMSSEVEKLNHIETSRVHLLKVQQEREHFKTIIRQTKVSVEGQAVVSPAQPCSFQGSIHYSFDMAQQVHVPSNPLQPGPIYFLSPYKLGIFGVMCDTLPKQCNFIIPESVVIVKGANFIVSLLHYYFENFGYGEEDMYLHADNCVAQNKNNVLMCYLSWRVAKGLNKSISLSFLPVGHTKFACDWAFGLFKKKFRKSYTSSIDDVCQVVANSTPTSKLNFAVKTGTESGDVLVPTYDWQVYFTELGWKKIPGITKLSHFEFKDKWVGKVQTKTDCNGNSEMITIDKYGTVDPEGFPSELVPQGLSRERKQYLYDHIREYCTPETKDLVCPEPETQESEEGSDEDEIPIPQQPASTARRRLQDISNQGNPKRKRT